jgi:hypothetical protein
MNVRSAEGRDASEEVIKEPRSMGDRTGRLKVKDRKFPGDRMAQNAFSLAFS